MSFREWMRLIVPIGAVMLVTLAAVFGLRLLRATPTLSGGGMARLEPASGTYYGVNLDWVADSPGAYNARLGHGAAVFVQFFPFPLQDTDLANFDAMIAQLAEVHGTAMITLEPDGGLGVVTPEAADALAARLAQANARGVPVFLRFAHEMNGSWYAWGEQPQAYVRAFRLVADAIHRRAPQTAMLWAPNYGGGYPFAGGKYEAKTNTPDFTALDTNHDGRLNMADDPYAPYYPGDDAVDWVGMSLYHWGSAVPWGENEMPEPGKFIAQLTGAYDGLNGDDSAIPDFYHDFFEIRHKPLAITETAALYKPGLPGNPGRPGSAELALKQAWWRQVFDPAMLKSHPGIKMINWFEHEKPETEIGGAAIDWRAAGSPDILAAFKADLPLNQLVFAP